MRRATPVVVGVALLAAVLAGCSTAPRGAPGTSTGGTAYPRLTPTCPRATSTGAPPAARAPVAEARDRATWQFWDGAAAAC